VLALLSNDSRRASAGFPKSDRFAAGTAGKTRENCRARTRRIVAIADNLGSAAVEKLLAFSAAAG
jgi:hypothetical protein